MTNLRTYAVSCILARGLGDIVHTIAQVDAGSEPEAAGLCEDAAMEENPGYRLWNTATLLIADPWDDPAPSTVATPPPGQASAPPSAG